MTCRELIKAAAKRFRDVGIPDPEVDAALLLSHLTGKPALALRLDMPAFMLKAVSSVIVVIAISGPYLRRQFPLLMKGLRMRSGQKALEGGKQ